MTAGKTIIKRLLPYLAALMAALALSAPLIIQSLINSDLIKSMVSRQIETWSGIKIAPGTMEFKLVPSPGISLTGLKLDLDRGIDLIIDRTDIRLDLGQLLRQQVAVSRIEIQGPRLDIPHSSPQTQPAAPSAKPRSLLALPAQLSQWLPRGLDELEIIVRESKTDYFSLLDGQLRIRDGGAELSLDINEVDIPMDRVPDRDRFLPSPLNTRIKGVRAGRLFLKLKLEPGTDTTAALKGQIRVSSPSLTLASLPETPVAAGNINLNFSLSDNGISAVMPPCELTYPKAGINIEFKTGPQYTHPQIIFSGRRIDIGQAREATLALLRGNGVVDHLFEVLRAGRAEKVTVGFKADELTDLFNGNNLYLEGNAKEAKVKIPQVPLMVEHTDGSAEIKDGVLKVNASKGEVDAALIRSGRLDLDLVNYRDTPFHGRFEMEARLAHLPQTLMALLPGTDLAAEMENISQISGRADAVLKLEMAPGSDELGVQVHAKKITASGRYSRIPLPLHISRGEFAYNGGHIFLKDLDIDLGTCPVKGLNARIRLGSPYVMTLEQAQAQIKLGELMPWVSSLPWAMEMISPAKHLDGGITLDRVSIHGPFFTPSLWQFDVKGSGQGISIGFHQDSAAVQHLSCRFKINQDYLDIQEMSGDINDISWLPLAPGNLASIRVPLKLHDARFRAQKGKDYFTGSMVFDQGPRISLNLEGEHLSEAVPTLVMVKDAGLTDAMVIPIHQPDKPQFSFEGRLNTLSIEKMLVKGSPLYERLKRITAGTHIIIFTDDQSRLHVNTPKINLDAILSQGTLDREPGNSDPGRGLKGRPLLAQKQLLFKTDTLKFKGKEFLGVDADLSFSPEKTEVKINHAGLCGIAAKGQVDLFHTQSGPLIATSFNIQAQDQKDISHVLGCLLGTNNIIKGGYSLKSQFSGKATQDLIMGRQNGSLDFKAEAGRIYKATILSRVLSVLNILGETDLRQQGFGYKTFTVNAEIKDSVIRLKKAHIDADNMAIVASGWVDPLNDKLDLTFLVAPFKTIDTIIQHIPVVNTILSGRLVSFPAQAKGKLSDPTVIPLHPSAVGKGLITLFGDLIQAPVRLIKGNNTNE